MRENLPVIETKAALTPTDYLIFRTDLKGCIVFANPAFVYIGGHSHEELVGAPHNLVRHPDMPEAAFADLQATLRASKVWCGLIRNRRKDGGFYWILANVMPVFQDNAVVDYTSVCSMATPTWIMRTQCAYAATDEGDTSHTTRADHILCTGWRCAVNLFRIGSLRFKMIGLQTLIVSAILIDTVWAHMALEAAGLHDATWLVFSCDWLWLVGVGYAGLATTSDMLLARTLTRPLEEAATLTTRLAAGGLTAAVEVRSSDELGEVMRAMSTIYAGLSSIIRDIRDGAASAAHGMLQISAGNHGLSVRTEQQAVVLGETASNMEELISMVAQNTDHARAASALAEQASATAADDGQVVQHVVRTIDAIRADGQRVAGIIATIKSIAFQTNILAFNTTVETIHADEKDRGFAVVTGEVRSPAQRNAQTTAQSKEIIRASDQSVRDGVDLVHKTGATITQIVRSVQTITQLTSKISASSREQNSDITQINTSVSQLDGATQQNATLVEEAAAATSALARQSEDLKHTVAVFRT